MLDILCSSCYKFGVRGLFQAMVQVRDNGLSALENLAVNHANFFASAMGGNGTERPRHPRLLRNRPFGPSR
jgi:hypothetical protein